VRPDQVFLEYLLTDSACTVFVVTSDTLAAIDLHLTRESLADLVEFSRKTVDGPDNLKAKELWRVPLRRLYASLIQPVAERGYLRGKRSLLIAPHGELHFLSFAALIAPGKSDRFLVEQFQIGYTPSATVWVELGERRFGSQPAGVLALAPDVQKLPGSRREAMAIGRIYGRNAIVRMGPAATAEALRAALPAVGVVHLATFGVLNKHNPLFSFVELAPSPQDDGRLEVNEVFGLNLSGQLVILSACQTGLASGALADVPPGDDWVGLLQAFLQAGARSVLATLWPVEDRATGALMEQFHERLATGIPPVTALAEAQRSLLRNPATAQPRYWAGFTANGRSE
jgi:CHAT domain-containing protein